VPTVSESFCGVKFVLLETRGNLAAIYLATPVVALTALTACPTHAHMLAATSDRHAMNKAGSGVTTRTWISGSEMTILYRKIES
jgi:hypothetical protein